MEYKINLVTTKCFADADSLIFSTVAKAQQKNPCEGKEDEFFSDFETCKHMFDTKIKFLKAKIKQKEIQMFISGKNNFRYNIFPDYKKNRVGKALPLFLRELKQYAVDRYGAIESHGAEADDYTVFYANKYRKALILAIDKDVKTQVTNKVYDYWKEQYEEVNLEFITRAPYLQTLTGDAGDGIIGLWRIGPKTALKIFDGTWKSVEDAYIAKDRTKEEALLNMRLVRLDQYNPEIQRLTLWNP